MSSFKDHKIRTGAALVETAIVIPVMLVIALGCADFGRVFHAQAIVSNAARCGAEYGSTHGYTNLTRSDWEAAVEEAVTEEMRSLNGFDSGKQMVLITTTTDIDGLFRVSVQVTYPFELTAGITSAASPLQLTRRVEMRRSR